MSISKGLNKETNKETNKGEKNEHNFFTRIVVMKTKYGVVLKPAKKSKNMNTFSGSIYSLAKDENGKRKERYVISWGLKYDLPYIEGFTDENEDLKIEIANKIMEEAKESNHTLYKKYMEFNMSYNGKEETKEETSTASEESAVSSDAPEVESEDKEIVVPAISNAKAYCNRLGARSYSEGLEHAIVELHKQATYISELEAKIENLKDIPAAEKELTREEIDQIVYDYMPAEFAQAPARVEELEEELAAYKQMAKELELTIKQDKALVDSTLDLTTKIYELEEMVAKLQSDNKSLNSDLEKAEDAYYAATNTIDDLTKDIQPEAKVEVEVPTLDITAFKNEIKSELKAELLEELKAELKAQSPAPVVKEEPKKEVKKEEIKKETKTKEDVDTKLVIPGKTTKTKKEEDKKVEVKVEQPKKKKKLSEMTYEDLANAEYEKLQKIGSALKLGSANVAKKADLVILIAKKLKLTIPAAKSASDDVDTTIVKPQTNSSLAAKRNNFSEIEDEMLDEIMDEIDDSDLGGSDIKVQDEYTVELNDAQKKLKAMLNAKANK